MVRDRQVHGQCGMSDRCMVNVECLMTMLGCIVNFLIARLSKHSPVLLEWSDIVKRHYPSRLNNCWALIPSFRNIMEEVWNRSIAGDPIYSVCTKLKNLTIEIKKWTRNNAPDLRKRVEETKAKLEDIQERLNHDISNLDLCHKEGFPIEEYKLACEMEKLDMRRNQRMNGYYFEINAQIFFTRP